MKKIMIFSGVFSAALLTTGVIFKYMHAPGGSILMTLGVLAACFIFIPLLFVLKVKEKQSGTDKLLVGLAALSGIMIALGILFKAQYWPGANVLTLTSLSLFMLVFLPVYLGAGIRPEARVNTIVTAMLMIIGGGLLYLHLLSWHS